MNTITPATELNHRLTRFKQNMTHDYGDWQMVVVFGKINLLYFTGTMQEGMLVIEREGESVLWVRRSIERARLESAFARIEPMDSYKTAASHYPVLPQTVYIEAELIPLAMLERFTKYFPFSNIRSADKQIAKTRSVKSVWELEFVRQSGILHAHVLENVVPQLLTEGMSETELATALYAEMVGNGHMGAARFAMFDTEMILGHVAFGESALYPTSFNGPGGNYGMGAALPTLGSRHRKLKGGDLVFIDVAFAVNGYHTDKTMTYCFKAKPTQHVMDEHLFCVEIQDKIAGMLVPGAIPSEIYKTITENLPKGFEQNFMGFGKRSVKFLGHGIGLTVDETPVIAKGFDEPLDENMVIALEPKKGIEGIGMVGIENTFIVTPVGGECITGHHRGLLFIE